MLVKFTDYSTIIDVMPCIDKGGRFMISIAFSNGDDMAYSFTDKEGFLSAYRTLVNKMEV